MSGQNIDQEDPNVIAARAERELNSTQMKNPHFDSPRSKRQGDSTEDSGVDDSVESRFPGAKVTIGSAASGAGDNREITDEEGGYINPDTGKQTKAGDFEGIGGPEDKAKAAQANRPGDDDVRGNIRQGGDTRRPNPTGGDVQ